MARVTGVERNWAICVVFETLAVIRYSWSGSTEVSIITGTPSGRRPKRAGSPWAGGRLKTGTATRTRPNRPGTSIVTEAAPMTDSSGQ